MTRGLVDDVRPALRAIRSAPLVSSVAVLSLALGMGANTALFSLVDRLLLRTLPVVEPDRLVTISSATAIKLGFAAGGGWNRGMWTRFRERADAFDGTFAWTQGRFNRFNLASHGEAQMVNGISASGDFFATLGVPALLGRTFDSADDVKGGGADGPVAVISYRLWQRRFDGDPRAIGASLPVNGLVYTVIGVMPSWFSGIEVGDVCDVIVPLSTTDSSESAFSLGVMVRLKDGQSLEGATAALRAIQPDVTPPGVPAFVREPFIPVPAGTGISMGLRQRYQRPLLIILGVAAAVLLIACANIANLLLARATARRHELSVRLALGAPRWRLMRQLLLESLVIGFLGAIAGLMFAVWGSQLLVSQLSTADAQVTLPPSLDWRMLTFTAAVAVATALMFGIAPAIRGMQTSPLRALHEQGRGAAAGSRVGIAGSVIVAQVALSLVLVVAAGLFVRTFERLTAVPLGFDRDRVLVVNVDTARAHREDSTRLDLYDRLVEAISTLPGVAQAAASVWIPAGGGSGLLRDVRGRSVDERRTVANFVTPGWFATYRIRLRAGRDLIEADTSTAQPVAVVNETFARMFFPGRDPIGETLDASRSDTRRTIVGVVSDAASGSLRDPVPPTIYLPLAQSRKLRPPGTTSINISVRSAEGSPMLLARSVADALTAVSRDLSFTFRSMDESLDAAVSQERLLAMLSGFFAGLALLLAGLGLYGVTSYSVNRRRAEIGIRMALGADGRSVVELIVSRTAWLVGAGIVAGGAASLWLSQFVAPLLYALEPRDPWTFAIAALTLVSVAGVAGWLPARRASRIEPAEILRRH
jgi:putative ABC transport system permease protein